MEADKYRERYDEVFGRGPEVGRAPTWAEHMIGYMPKDMKGNTVLDAGCGRGDLLALCAARGAKVTGFDLNDYRMPAFRHLPFIRGSAADLPPGKKRFDFVTCSHAMEHLTEEDSRRCIAGMCRLARRGVFVSLGLTDCPEHLTVQPRGDWFIVAYLATVLAGFRCVQAAFDGVTADNIMVFVRREFAGDAWVERVHRRGYE